MGRDSTGRGQHVEPRTPQKSSELLTEVYRAVLSLSLDGRADPKSYQLSIVAPTLQAAHGIFQVASARIFSTALQDQSNGDSDDN